jgi:hypothetical protein
VLDIIILSVILDAGAGNVWKFSKENFCIGRSEGIAIASFFMFSQGEFAETPF